MSVREPAVAGMFYPDDPGALRRQVEGYIGAVEPRAARPSALIAPHAGYRFSGAVAGHAYAQLTTWPQAPERVLLLGPSHRVPFVGLALPEATRLGTPLGEIDIDAEAAATLVEQGHAFRLDLAHAQEHSLEVHLPFIQVCLPGAKVVPLAVGDVDAGSVAEAIASAHDERTLVIVSTDLSHFRPYAQAGRVDRRTTDAIEALDPRIEPEQACGCRPLNGLLTWARGRGLQVTTLDVRSSGDTAGHRDQVVGYGAYSVH